MRIAILPFDRFTALDAVGPYEVLSRLPGAETVFVAERTGPVTNDVAQLIQLGIEYDPEPPYGAVMSGRA
ncbi:MAG TPA: hypothetical protein VGH72_04485 [Pseudonocardia sp.]|jgi:putative intracellular protease/amidase